MGTITKNKFRLPWESKPTYKDNRHDIKFINSARWRGFSKAYLIDNPFCVECAKKGITELAKNTDHIVDRSKGGSLWDKNNLQGLCIPCHTKKTFQK